MKIYTFHVAGSFKLQYSFPESDLRQDEEGREGELVPTEAAISALQEELQAAFGYNYAVDSIELSIDGDDLLGVSEAP